MPETLVAEQIRARLRVRRGLPDPDERRRIRETAGLSRQELADAIGVTRQAIGHWETGARQAPRNPTVFERYVEALRVLREAT